MSIRKKIGLVGSGNIGGTLAQMALARHLGDIVLVDVAEGIPQGKALDLSQWCAIEGIDFSVTGSNDYAALKDADVVIVTAGVARKPGMSRDDLLEINAKVMKAVGAGIQANCPQAFVICVTNPLDVMVSVLQHFSGVPDNRIAGMAGVLDSARFRRFLAWEFSVSVDQVQAYVLGGHGDSMVPLTGLSNVAGISLDECVRSGKLSAERLAQIVQRTRDGGAEVVNLLKTGSAFYAPAAAALYMAESVLLDKKRIVPCAAKLKAGDYGVQSPMFVGVPAKLGATGVEEIITVKLTDTESQQLQKSIQAVIELNKAVEKFL